MCGVCACARVVFVCKFDIMLHGKGFLPYIHHVMNLIILCSTHMHSYMNECVYTLKSVRLNMIEYNSFSSSLFLKTQT